KNLPNLTSLVFVLIMTGLFAQMVVFYFGRIPFSSLSFGTSKGSGFRKSLPQKSGELQQLLNPLRGFSYNSFLLNFTRRDSCLRRNFSIQLIKHINIR